MKKTFALLAALVTFAASAAIDMVALGYGESVDVTYPAKVAAVECFSDPTNGTYSLKKETTVPGVRYDVEEHALTNFTYSVVTTNLTGAVTTNVLDRPHPVPYPETMTGYWTNTVVSAWNTTNAVPISSATFTNAVEAAAYLAPGDRLFTLEGDTFRGKLYIWLER